MKRRISAFLLALLTILMTACSTATLTETDTPEAEVTEPGAQSEMTEETEEPDPFEGADYDGRTFCIYTSVNEATVGAPRTAMPSPIPVQRRTATLLTMTRRSCYASNTRK